MSGKYKAQLRTPPMSDDSEETDVGIVSYRFPAWFIIDWSESGARPIVHLSELERMRKDWQHKARLPMRFVRACSNGHIDDIHWQALVHGSDAGPEATGGQSWHGHEIWLHEHGPSGELSELSIVCKNCQKTVHLSEVRQSGRGLGLCTRNRPWLGDTDPVPCIDRKEGGPGKYRLLVRHASNAYFGVVDRAIAIPDYSQKTRAAVDFLVHGSMTPQGPGMLAILRQMIPAFQQLAAGLDDAEIFDGWQRVRAGGTAQSKSLKEREFRTFLSDGQRLGSDDFDSDFLAERTPLPKGPVGALLERVLLVHRLREVSVQIGFTRLEPPKMPVDDELDLGVTLAPLGKYPDGERWLPAVENRGEGVFVTLHPTRVAEWLGRPEVEARWKRLEAGLVTADRPERSREWILPYTLLHSLSHLLITALSLECGYAATSIRERIYVRPPKGGKPGSYGLLLYTATPDAEGTLGGLVETGRRLGHFISAAVRIGQLCANDPVCAEHDPGSKHDERPLHGASCHGCLLIAEPSCERRNELLDRALVVPTVGTPARMAFFDADGAAG